MANEFDNKQYKSDFMFAHLLNRDYLSPDEWEDSIKISNIILSKIGIRLSAVEAWHFWKDYSEEMDAGWIIIPEDKPDYIVKQFNQFMKNWFED